MGTPREIYRRPVSEFSATFLGSANIVATTVAGATPDGYRVRWSGGELTALGPSGLRPGQAAALVVRPEDVEVAAGETAGPGWTVGRLLAVEEAASTVRLRISVLGLELQAERAASPGAAIGAEVGDVVSVRLDAQPGWLVDSAPSAGGIVEAVRT